MKKLLLILIASIIILLILLLNFRLVNSYGLIKKEGNFFSFNAKIVDCELNSHDFVILNYLVIDSYDNKSLLINGFSLFDLLIINSINNVYDPKIVCFAKHESDIKIEPINYEVINANPTLIEYNITNNQDKRLYYDCRLITNCSLSRKYFTGYINPSEVIKVYFNVTCVKGSNNSTVKTVFVDELINYHTINQEIIINAV